MLVAIGAFSAPSDPDCQAFAREFVACLAIVGLSQKQAALWMGIDEPRLCRYLKLGTLPLAFAAKLPLPFWHVFLPRLAARFGMGVVSASDAALIDAIRLLRRVFGGETSAATGARPCAESSSAV